MPSSTQKPLVSCLCVTRNKPRQLRRAVDCFLAQRYSPKELLLVYEDDDLVTQHLAEQLVSEHEGLIFAKQVAATPKLTLGELRNIAIASAHGEYFCQWDDDDWYHQDRISRQLEAATGNHQAACLLSHWLIYDELGKQAYLSPLRLWEGSILSRKDVLTPELKYPALSKSEDSIFIGKLLQKGAIYPLVAPVMYIYTVHQSNTWSRAHFERIFSASQKLSPTAALRVGEILAGEYSVEAASELLGGADFMGEFRYLQELMRFMLPAGDNGGVGNRRAPQTYNSLPVTAAQPS
jgi:glycosyltransferase involved in cell wall biosynthesis